LFGSPVEHIDLTAPTDLLKLSVRGNEPPITRLTNLTVQYT